MANTTETSDARPARRLPWWKKALFGLVVAALFFGLLEGVLAVIGVKPLLYQDDPYVGFSGGKVPLFVKKGEDLVTADNKVKWFNEQNFPRKKLKGATRIFCLGGSTTYGRPFRDETSFCGWLREYLPAADASQQWEVINAGGISYASYRIAALMEELVAYEPDLFIIYCGHNEFLEDRTYGELMEMPAAVRGLQASLSHSRTYSLLSRMIKGGKRADKASELRSEVNTILDTVGTEAYARDVEWQKQVMAHYRFNLARMVDIARANGAEVMFVMPASNLRNSSPFKSQHRDGLTPDERAAWDGHFAKAKSSLTAGDHEDALTAIDQALAIDGLYADALYLRGRILEALGLGKTAEAKAAYELALENDICPLRMLAAMQPVLREVAKARGVPVVDFPALVEEHARDGIPGEDLFLDHVHPTIEAHRLLALALVDQLENQGALKRSASWNDEVVARVKERVMAGVDDHERGIALRNLANVLKWAGKYEDAYAAAKKSLELAPGDAYANFVTGDLAEKLGETEEAMKQYKFLTGFTVNTEDAPYFVETHYKYAGLLLDKSEFAECVRMLRKAIKLKPGHEEATKALPMALQTWATTLLQVGKGAEALEPLEQLRQLNPGDANVRNWMGIALIQSQRPQEAIPHLEAVLRGNQNNPAAHNNLASAYAQSGDKENAAKHFQETVRLNPGHLGALNNLGELYFESGDDDHAAEFFNRVLQLQPGHPAATARLAQIEARRATLPAP